MSRSQGFTLVELMIVIAIIAFLYVKPSQRAYPAAIPLSLSLPLISNLKRCSDLRGLWNKSNLKTHDHRCLYSVSLLGIFSQCSGI